MSAPVVLLSFANDQGNYLRMLVRERKAIAGALRTYEDRRCIRVQVEPNAGIDDVFDLFNRFADQVAIFHYAGHADGAALRMEAAGGGSETAHAGGLAQKLGTSKALRLVFLNGCATADQVKALLDNGVPAVIATAVPIDDTMATEFAEQFYETLGGGKSIADAFASARAIIASRYGERRPIEAFRGMQWGEPAAAAPAPELTWGLYTPVGGEAALDWVLPEQAETQVIVRGAAADPAAGVVVNDGLIQTLFNALAPFSDELAMQLELSQRAGRLDLRTLRQQIMDAYPSPIGEQLRKLFTSTATDEARLRQLVAAYTTTVSLVAFSLLSQLWNARFDNPALAIDAEQRAAIESFALLDAKAAATFDHADLILAINGILAANAIDPFMPECADLSVRLVEGEGGAARRFMAELRTELGGGGLEPAELQSFCVQAEAHLGVLLSVLAFVVRYKLATIKAIAITKSRHKPAEFRHRQVVLDRVTAGFIDSDEVRAAFTDNESVILLKDLQDVSQYLNLTPFVIDQNALTGNVSTKLYFLRFHDALGDESHYYSIADPADVLVVGDVMDARDKATYLPIRALMDEFRTAMHLA